MSRIGRLPVAIPSGVDVKIDGQTVSVKGPKGQLSRTFHENMKIGREDGKISVQREDDSQVNRALHGLTRTLIANMAKGVKYAGEYIRRKAGKAGKVGAAKA